jgi:hypothetical protein
LRKINQQWSYVTDKETLLHDRLSSIIDKDLVLIIIITQDQAISTNYFKRKILKEEIESRCRLCKEYEETIDHLTSGCPILAKNEYIIRHGKVCTHLHYSICKTLGIEQQKTYSHIPKSVCQHEDITVLWNQGVKTDRFWQTGQT